VARETGDSPAVPERVFKAMADPTRQKILQVLVRTELAVSELVDVLRLPQSTVSRHLKVLRDAGLVRSRNRATTTIYSPATPAHPNGDTLPGQLLRWAMEQELHRPLAARLDRVVHRRRSESEAFFAQVADRWDQMRLDCFGATFHLEALAAVLPHDWVVADVGTGTGYLLPSLAATFAHVIAIDPVEEMLAAARARAGGLDNVEFRRGAATALPIGDGALDLCIASLVLHHEPNPLEAVSEFHRVLKPGGRVLIVEESAHHMQEFHDLMQDRWWGFDASELGQQVVLAGFADVRSRVLLTAEPANGSTVQAPDLFILTGKKRNLEADTSQEGDT